MSHRVILPADLGPVETNALLLLVVLAILGIGVACSLLADRRDARRG